METKKPESGRWCCTNEEYHASMSEDSHSSINLFIDSVEQYAARRVFRTVSHPEPNDAMRFGSLFHTVVLEPEIVEGEYIIAEKHDKRTKKGKEGWADFCRRAVGRRIVTQEDMDLANRMADGIHNNSMARELLLTDGECEAAFLHTDEVTQCPLKIRCDKVIPSSIIDFKTTERIDASSFSKTVHNFHYYRQASLYLDIMKALRYDVEKFIFIACSKTPPHECACYELGFNTLNLGRADIKQALFELSHRRRTGDWNGRYAGAVHTIDVPAYAFPKDF